MTSNKLVNAFIAWTAVIGGWTLFMLRIHW